MKKSLFSYCTAFAILFSNCIFSQTVPDNTRLLQINTSRGSALSLVESSKDFVYQIGTSNASELGFDGLSTTSVGNNDLFILKSNVKDGLNVWLKSFDAGKGGSVFPRYIYADARDNLYVFANFLGTVNFGGNLLTSTSIDNAFLMKIDKGGNPIWVTSLNYSPLASNSKIKCVTDGVDTFLIYNTNSVLRINDANGSVMYNQTLQNVILKSLALKGENLYVAGSSTALVSIGSETIPGPNAGFCFKR